MVEVICVKVDSLRKQGYSSLEDWQKINSNHLYIGRFSPYVKGAFKSKWHNPFKVDIYNLESSLKKFKVYLFESNLIKDIEELDEKILGCWCNVSKNECEINCHGKVLMKYLSNFKRYKTIQEDDINIHIENIIEKYKIKRHQAIDVLREHYYIVY